MTALAWTVAGLALLPTALVAANLLLYRRAPRVAPTGAAPGSVAAPADGATPRVSVLIPARDEEERIGDAVRAALVAAAELDVEVLVMDDHSDDGTAAEVRTIEAADRRARLLAAPELPSGWNGKQHACARLAEAARGEVLLFQDADVRLEPGAVPRILAALEQRGAALVSGFPRQQVGSLVETALIPLIHLVLLGYLPMLGMRWSSSPAFAAGCGQLFACSASAYRRAGGHATIRTSRHDGLTLPRAFRARGLHTDLFDATDVARCRMYGDAASTVRGLMKNADEGMATPGGILPWTLLLLGGHVVPWLALPLLLLGASGPWMPPMALALTATVATRAVLAARFRQPLRSVLLSPFGVSLLVGIQWAALVARLRGRPLEWKGRARLPGVST